MGWFKTTIYPEYWKQYVNSFNKGYSLEHTRFVVFDTETTGLNPKQDRLLSIGTVTIINFKIDVADQLECYIKQEHFNAKTVEIHGILKEGPLDKIEEEEAIKQFLKHIEGAILVAHHVHFDVTMINEALKRLGLPKLKNKTVDTGTLYRKTKYIKTDKHYSLDDLCNKFNITMHDRHTASGDAYLTAILFLKLCALLKEKNKGLTLKEILRRY